MKSFVEKALKSVCFCMKSFSSHKKVDAIFATVLFPVPCSPIKNVHLESKKSHRSGSENPSAIGPKFFILSS